MFIELHLILMILINLLEAKINLPARGMVELDVNILEDILKQAPGRWPSEMFSCTNFGVFRLFDLYSARKASVCCIL